MEVTRKGFIASAATALVAAAALPSTRALAEALPSNADLSPAAANFASHVGSSFELTTAEGARVSVILRDVVGRKSHPKTEQFSLAFATGNGARLPQGTYSMRHPALGSMAMFLAPQGHPASDALQADFNLLRA